MEVPQGKKSRPLTLHGRNRRERSQRKVIRGLRCCTLWATVFCWGCRYCPAVFHIMASRHTSNWNLKLEAPFEVCDVTLPAIMGGPFFAFTLFSSCPLTELNTALVFLQHKRIQCECQKKKMSIPIFGHTTCTTFHDREQNDLRRVFHCTHGSDLPPLYCDSAINEYLTSNVKNI